MDGFFQNVSLNVLQRQFGYTNLSDLILKRSGVWDDNFSEASETFRREVLDFSSCTSDALENFWGKLYQTPRKFFDANGNILTLTDTLYREIIKIRAFGSRWSGNVREINDFMHEIFAERGNVFVFDPQNMSIILYVFNFDLTPEEYYLFNNCDVLPRPAGLGIGVIQALNGKWFGFAECNQAYPSPITVGFGTCTGGETGRFATCLDVI